MNQPDQRLRFWLFALDLCSALRVPTAVYLWCVGKASDATDWGPPLDRDPGRDPF
jgi:hypothetical protein